MKNEYFIITGILIIAVFSVGVLFMLFNESQASLINNTITDKGTKLAFKNDNNQVWEHVDMIIPNATLRNGTTKTIYIEVWVKPGGTMIIDLSNLLGYENNPLPSKTNLKVLAWCGLFNPTSGGTGDFKLTLQGWSNTPTSQNGPQSTITQASMPIGQLPLSISRNTAIISSEKKVEAVGENRTNEEKTEVLFTEMSFMVDTSGNLEIMFPVRPNLSQTNQQII